MIVVAVAVVMWESPQGFPRGVGRVESRLYGFPCFPHPGISMAGFLAVFGFIIPALRARAHRAERNKHRNRHEKRAFDTEVSEEELLELFSEYLEHIEDAE